MNKETDIKDIFIEDKPTKFASLGWRCVYTTICWLILGNNISSDRSFIVSLFIFSMPLFMDYLKFIPIKKRGWRIVVRRLGILLSGIWLSLGVLGLLDIINMCKIESDVYFEISKNFIVLNNFRISAKIIWCLIGLSVFLTLIDYIAYENPIEKRVNNKR
ncbi:hypothetical protein [Abyssisolibacter fermentans]|uniref:hypothetical protein n=1 Tax=Abyssisolibacter fermentans TaxID=1766203 RepID=UPI0008357BDD|nr:hypothetical protein [Abyssisolibacter fermentans]